MRASFEESTPDTFKRRNLILSRSALFDEFSQELATLTHRAGQKSKPMVCSRYEVRGPVGAHTPPSSSTEDELPVVSPTMAWIWAAFYR